MHWAKSVKAKNKIFNVIVEVPVISRKVTMTERDKQIIELYLNNPELTVKEIGKKFNVSSATVTRIARINNLPRRKGDTGVRLSNAEIESIKEKYKSGISLFQLQKKYKISYNKVKNIVKDCPQVSIAKQKNPFLKEDYFQSIDSKQKAYWLGWIISDGSITNNPKKGKFQLELTILSCDESILHLLENDLGVSNKVYPFQKNYKRFSLGYKKIVQDLEKMGIVNNKSITVHVPNFNSNFNSSFLRGLFDGDGGFSHYQRTTGQICNEISFCGNQYVIAWVRKTLLEEIPNLSPNKITQLHSIKRIRWSSQKDIGLIKNYLYKDCDEHYLERKYNLIQANTEVTN